MGRFSNLVIRGRRCTGFGFSELDRNPRRHNHRLDRRREALLDWLEQTRLAPAYAVKAVRAEALPGELDSVANQVRSPWEWFRCFLQRRTGRLLVLETLEELEPLNRLPERDETFGRITLRQGAGAAHSELEVMRRWRSPKALLLSGKR